MVPHKKYVCPEGFRKWTAGSIVANSGGLNPFWAMRSAPATPGCNELGSPPYETLSPSVLEHASAGEPIAETGNIGSSLPLIS
jgi:hypothetical protein